MTKEARKCNGEKPALFENGVGKTRQLHEKVSNSAILSHYAQK